MTGDDYRANAAEVLAMVERATDPDLKSRLEEIAAAYTKLADQADEEQNIASD